MSESVTTECGQCGKTYTESDADDDGRVVCYGNPIDSLHGQTVVIRPCGICGDPITTAEICHDCADEHDGDAFTTNWGKGA